MASITVEILNPKAKKLLQALADLKLISILEPEEISFLAVVKRIREKESSLTLDEVTAEVEAVRVKRHEGKG